MFNLLFNGQFYKENYVKSHQQVVTEYRDRTSRISAGLSAPGYSRVMVQNPDGSYSFRRAYTAHYLQYAQSDRGWVLYKVLYSLLFVVGAVLSVLAMMAHSALNMVPYIGALGTLSVLPLLYLAYTMFYQISAPRRMEIRQYNMAFKRMRIAALVYGLYLVVPLTAIFVYVITNDFVPSPTDVFCIAGLLLDAILIFLMFGLEINRRCIPVQNILPDNMEIIG